MPQVNRYIRQIQLPQVGEAGQALLTRAHVAVVGAGGLGCPVLQYLAGAGVGRISVLDPDTVEESNLHRQPIYRMTDVGRPKALVASEAIRALNPLVRVDARAEAVGPGTAPMLAASADLVIDAADSFAVSYILSDACQATGTPFISASVLGQTGYVGAFCAGAPSLRAVFPELPENGATCASAGVLGPVVGTLGALQAQIALRVLLTAEPSPLGQLVTLDLAQLSFGGFGFRGAPEPNDVVPFVATHMLGDRDLIIDLRDNDEAPGNIVNHALSMSENELQTLSCVPERRIVLCCDSGVRAWRGAAALKARGAASVALLAARACT